MIKFNALNSGIAIEKRLNINGNGADDYEDDEGVAYSLIARIHGKIVGTLVYNEITDDKELHIRWIEVPTEMRRKGIGSILVDKLKTLYPIDWSLTTNGLTDEGTKFNQSLNLGLE